MFYRLDVLPVTQPTVSKHWSILKPPATWPHPLFIHHWTPGERHTAAFTPSLMYQDVSYHVVTKMLRCCVTSANPECLQPIPLLVTNTFSFRLTWPTFYSYSRSGQVRPSIPKANAWDLWSVFYRPDDFPITQTPVSSN